MHGWLGGMLSRFALDGGPVASAGIRPEAVRLGTLSDMDAADRAAGRGTIVDIVPTGGSWIVELDIQGSRFFAIATENPQKAAGDTTHFWVERQHLHLFDRDKNRIAL